MTLRIIAGKFKGRLLKTPKGLATRPTQGTLREAVFNICQNEISNARFLDLFAGSGAMGLEALSRGALRVTFVEQNRAAVSCVKDNIAALRLESHTALLPLDANRAIALLVKQSAQFEIVYVDPPYDTPFDLTPLIPLLVPEAILFLEERHHPKKIYAPPILPYLELKDTRRFGTALLSTFHYKIRRIS